MLILSRKKDDRIMIGDNIVITVVDFEGERVKIGIEAPKDIRVFRMELIDKTKEDNTHAAKTNVTGFDELLKNVSDK
jgi:carbon storage regulator